MRINSITLLSDWEQDCKRDPSWNGRVKFQDGRLEKNSLKRDYSQTKTGCCVDI